MFKKVRILPTKKQFIISSVLLGFLVMIAPDPAHALRVSLKRLTFEGKARSQVITIINNESYDETYRLGWKNFRMGERKVLVGVPEGEEGDLKLAAPLLRYAPRRFTVKAGSSQQVRLVTRFPRDLEDGEYRSHLYILPEAKPIKFTADELKEAKAKPVVKIGLIAGLSVPVFVRKGKLEATATLSDVSVTKEDDKLKLSIVLERAGNRSLFGDLDFTCTAGEMKGSIIGQNTGIAVYPEVNKRYIDLEMPYPKGECSEMRIDYVAEASDAQYQGGVMTSKSVSLP